MESIYEYGSRAWLLAALANVHRPQGPDHRLWRDARHGPQPGSRRRHEGSRLEIASHGYRWLEYKDFPEAKEREHILEAVRLHTKLVGERPYGMYQGKPSDNTLRLVMEEGGFLYSSDSYADDLPYWVPGLDQKPFLIIPYTLETNDMRFATPQGFNAGDQFLTYLKDAFDVLYQEGREGAPKMMSVGLHCRLVGRPGRAAALKRFIEYVLSHDKVWIPQRLEIAKHWHEHHKPAGTP